MGLYLNPLDESKETWLHKHGMLTTAKELTEEYDKLRSEGMIPVILVNNGAFTAAGIGFDQRETSDFCDPMDHRRKLFYKAPIAELMKIEDPEFRRLLMKLI